MVRVSVVEADTVDTQLIWHVREEVRQAATSQVPTIEPLRPEDNADAVAYIVTRDRRVVVNEISSTAPIWTGEPCRLSCRTERAPCGDEMNGAGTGCPTWAGHVRRRGSTGVMGRCSLRVARWGTAERRARVATELS